MIWLFWTGILIGGIIGAVMAYWVDPWSDPNKKRIKETTDNGIRKMQEMSFNPTKVTITISLPDGSLPNGLSLADLVEQLPENAHITVDLGGAAVGLLPQDPSPPSEWLASGGGGSQEACPCITR